MPSKSEFNSLKGSFPQFDREDQSSYSLFNFYQARLPRLQRRSYGFVTKLGGHAS